MVLPNLFVPGAGKSGTSTLHNHLKQHPKIFMSPWKEPQFFSHNTANTAGMVGYEEGIKAYEEYFKGVEEIFRRYEGRPHWAKLHTRTRDEFASLYPKWEDFHEIRRRLDPHGTFLNPYLESIFP